MTDELINEYGNLNPNHPFTVFLRDLEEECMSRLEVMLDSVPLHDLASVLHYSSFSWGAYYSSYILKRQMFAKRGQRSGKWQPGYPGHGSWWRVDGLTWNNLFSFTGYCKDMRSMADIEVGKPLDFETWNGWVKPAFSLEQGLDLSDYIEDMHYSITNDSFALESRSFSSDVVWNPFEARVHTTSEDGTLESKDIKLYAIGAGYFSWSIMDNEGDNNV